MSDRITYIGHSTALIEVSGRRFLTDPMLRDRVLHIRRRVALPADDRLLEADAVLVSHAHLDHLDRPSLRRVGGACPVVVPRGCARLLRRTRLPDVREIDVGERIALGPVDVVATRAAHDGRRLPFTRPLPALGYVLEGSSRVYFAGDTELFEGMREIRGELDLALLPIWGWGSVAGSGHMDPERAAEALALLKPRIVVPIHWGTLSGPSRGPRDLGAPARAFARLVSERAPAVDVRVLAPGESVAL
jgi:L-ascorbate metabolism protein UlaG (beta-lactamase superfamily)